jgi:hypothetical protein
MLEFTNIDRSAFAQQPMALRQSLKREIDTWPIELVMMTWEFAAFEKQRMHITAVPFESEKAVLDWSEEMAAECWGDE